MDDLQGYCTCNECGTHQKVNKEVQVTTRELYNPKDKAEVRDLLLKEQDYKCAITGLPLDKKEAVLEHSHDDEMFVRGVASRAANSALGVLENALTTPARPKKIFLVYNDEEIDLRDVFKFPPNHYTRATKLGIPFYQYCANLFKKSFKVKFSINREWYWVEPNEVELGNFNLNLAGEFLDFCKNEEIEI